MKGLKFVLTLSVAFISLGLSAQQSPFPPLKQNEAAKTLIQRDIDYLEQIIKNSPSPDLDRKLDLYQMAVDFLNEPTQIKATTEYALTSAFLNHEVKWNNLSDSDAFMKYRIRQWSKEFQELINLVKI
jgi:hypothetical protein